MKQQHEATMDMNGDFSLANPDQYFMRIALEQAREGAAQGEVPVGVIIVLGYQILAKAHNLRETLQDPTAHAEILALTQAAEALGTWRLEDTTAYITLEPCPMCAGALVQSRVKRVVFGALDPKAGAAGSIYNILEDDRLNHRLEVRGQVMADESRALLQEFFRQKRREQKVSG